MSLTNDEIATIAEWDSIRPGFGRDDPQTGIRINAIVDQVNSSGDVGCELLEGHGLSNHYVLFAFARADVPSRASYQRIDGLLIYLSACAPVGVVGRSRKCVGPGFEKRADPLAIEMLISPDQPERRLEIVTLEAIRSGGYEVLSVEEVSRPLPPGVKPYDDCRSPQPWDRVFHVLFGVTD